MKDAEFLELVKNIKYIKLQYKKIKGKKEYYYLAKDLKDIIYSPKVLEWKRDCLWKYLNDEIEYQEMLCYLKLDSELRPIRK